MRLPGLIRLNLFAILLMVFGSFSARADILYDNSSSGGTNVYYSVDAASEYGDEVVLGGSSRILSQILFESYGDFVASGDETAHLRIYKNDGPQTPAGDPTPGTLVYDSGAFPIVPGWQTKDFGGLSITVPTDLTWTIEFGGLSGSTGDRAGLVFRDPPTVGSSFDDFWKRSAGNWQLFTWNASPVANFAARIISGGEPTTVSIRRDTAKIIVEWTGLSILQVAPNASGPYTDISNARNRYEISPAAASMKFWRLRD